MTNPLRTLRGRLAFTYAALALLAVGVSAVYSAATLRGAILDRLALDVGDQARLLADGVQPALARGDRVAVLAYVERVDPLILARVLVVDAAGAPVAVSEPPPESTAGTDAALQQALRGDAVTSIVNREVPIGEIVQVTLPVADGSRLVGAVRASYTVDDVQATVWRLNATTALVGGGVALVAAMLGLLLATSVALPAGRVAQAALDLAEQRPSDPLPEPVGSTEEIRSLVRAFNGLAAQLGVHEQARREFASDVSHELHSLASAMQTAAEALERGAAEANPALGQRLVGGLVGHTRRLSRLADDLLELARWEGGRLRVDAHDTDLGDLVRGTLDEWTSDARRRGISLQARLPSGPLPIYGDPIRLTQALGNLVENALKYAGPEGWVRVDVEIVREPGGSLATESYTITVTDSGPGIPADVLPRVFERYFRVEGRASGGPGGMGLGLAIARAIVLAHNGELTAESPTGSGARFVLRLPRPARAPAARAAPAATEVAPF